MSATSVVDANANRGPELLAITWVFTVLALLVVIAKFYTKVKILRGAGLDDFLVVLSMVLVLICTALFSADVHLGMGRHASSYPDAEKLRSTVRLNLIANPFGIMAYSLPNIAVAIQLNRIMVPRRYFRWAIFSIAIAQSIIAGISCILLFAQCTPAKHLWNPTVPARCLSPSVITGYSYFVGAYSAFTDVFLAAVPAALFWNLQVRTKTKVGLMLLMGMTAVAAICAIVKTTKLNELADLSDFTYGTVDLIIWAIVEGDVIIIAACIPTLRPFIISVQKSAQGSEARSRFGKLRGLRSSGYSRSERDNATNGSERSQTGGMGMSGVSEGSYSVATAEPSIQGESRWIALPPYPRIKQTTEVATEWETV